MPWLDFIILVLLLNIDAQGSCTHGAANRCNGTALRVSHRSVAVVLSGDRTHGVVPNPHGLGALKA